MQLCPAPLSVVVIVALSAAAGDSYPSDESMNHGRIGEDSERWRWVYSDTETKPRKVPVRKSRRSAPTDRQVHTPINPKEVKVVHLIQSNHLDIGFSDYASNVINRYMTGEWGTAAPPEPRNKSMYYPSFFLNAANTSRILRQRHGGGIGSPGYVYLVHPWLVSLFLSCNSSLATFPSSVSRAKSIRCPSDSQRALFEDSLRRGDAVMQAFPHSAQAEVLGVDGFEAALNMGAELADRYGIQRPAVLSQRDVPGLTRGVVPHLSRHGVIGVSVGANDGSPPPIVPSTIDCYHGYQQIRTPFLWQDKSSNTSVIVDIHPGGYGGEIPLLQPGSNSTSSYFSRDGLLCDCVGVPGLPEVMCYAFRGDNYGPASANETEQNWRMFGKAFPNATVKASTLDSFFKLLATPSIKSKLPVVTSEIGDTWIYGVSSDPQKTSEMRAMMRARAECVLVGKCSAALEPGLSTFTHLLLKAAEHTWGGSYAGHMLVSQPTNWSNQAFNEGRKKRVDPFYDVAEESWDEQRRYLAAALTSLEPSHPHSAPALLNGDISSPTISSKLAMRIRDEIRALRAPPPDLDTLKQLGYTAIPPTNWTKSIRIGASASSCATVSFDLASGAWVQFERDGIQWATPARPLARFMYRTHSYEEKCTYAKTYTYSHGGEHPYSPGAYTPPSPGLNTSATLQSQQFYAPVTGIWRHNLGVSNDDVMQSVVLRLDGSAMGAACYSKFSDIWVNLTSSNSNGDLAIELVWASKTPTRLPESAWFEFRPALPSRQSKWLLTIDKVGSAIDSADVVGNGGSALHGVAPNGSIAWRQKGSDNSALSVKPLDAALVSPGRSTNILNWSVYNDEPPSAEDGAAFNLYNNLYTTNYILYWPWNESDSVGRFRFQLIL